MQVYITRREDRLVLLVSMPRNPIRAFALFLLRFVVPRPGVGPQLDSYVVGAMQHATFEVLPGEGVYGEIPGIQGVYSLADTEEESRRELADVLREWIVFRQQQGLRVPSLDDLSHAYCRLLLPLNARI